MLKDIDRYVEELKILIGIQGNEKDKLLKLLIKKSETDVKNYCNIDLIPEELRDAVIDIAVIKYNRIGTEGANSENFSGVSTTYETRLPPSIKNILNRHRGVFR